VTSKLIRPNTLLDVSATEAAREAAVANVVERRSFERGQLIVRAGDTIDDSAYEALDILGLLKPSNHRLEQIARAGLVSIVVMVITGLYVSRFKPSLLKSSRFLTLLAIIFLLVLFGARVSSFYGQIYLYPTAALALIYVALVGPEVAIIGVLGQAVLIGFMYDNYLLELPMLVGVGGMMAALTLRRPERLNGYFMPGLIVGISNIAVTLIFYPTNYSLNTNIGLLELLLYNFLNGILAAGVALVGIYILTLLFNLPTGLKLIELSQPNQPLLQRLLREAPGTYQHSLLVANLAEQAANAIGVNADLVRVAALYHDIGKITNPAFFTENQIEGANPHNVLDDPTRSAAIIIGHVTEGDKIARQYHLPARIRDFILEHHGTQVLYFYQEAVKRAGADEVVDIEQFTYPGPKPQTRETGVVMLADSCEAAVRSHKPTKKQEITDTIQEIIDHKIQTGQLDESGLTFNDVKAIQKVFIEMLQAVFHPRINYPSQLKPIKEIQASEEVTMTQRVEAVNGAVPTKVDIDRIAVVTLPAETDEQPASQYLSREIPMVDTLADETEDAPLPEVPPLPRTSEQKTVKLSGDNGSSAHQQENSDEQ
jgi:putative nucleotidyltransferase with HDIG domain